MFRGLKPSKLIEEKNKNGYLASSFLKTLVPVILFNFTLRMIEKVEETRNAQIHFSIQYLIIIYEDRHLKNLYPLDFYMINNV